MCHQCQSKKFIKVIAPFSLLSIWYCTSMGEFKNLFLLCLEQALWSNFHSLSFTCTRLYYLHLLQLVCSYFFLLFSAKVSYDKLFDTIKWSFVFSIKVQVSSSSKLGQIGPYGVQGQIWKTKFVRPSLTFLYHL